MPLHSDQLSFNPVSRIRFKSSIYSPEPANDASDVSIPFPGFASNQERLSTWTQKQRSGFNPVSRIRFKSRLSRTIYCFRDRKFQSRFQDSLQIKSVQSSELKTKLGFQSRFQDSLQIKILIVISKDFPFIVSIPFPGFASNQV